MCLGCAAFARAFPQLQVTGRADLFPQGIHASRGNMLIGLNIILYEYTYLLIPLL